MGTKSWKWPRSLRDSERTWLDGTFMTTGIIVSEWELLGEANSVCGKLAAFVPCWRGYSEHQVGNCVKQECKRDRSSDRSSRSFLTCLLTMTFSLGLSRRALLIWHVLQRLATKGKVGMQRWTLGKKKKSKNDIGSGNGRTASQLWLARCNAPVLAATLESMYNTLF